MSDYIQNIMGQQTRKIIQDVADDSARHVALSLLEFIQCQRDEDPRKILNFLKDFLSHVVENPGMLYLKGNKFLDSLNIKDTDKYK